MEKNLDDLSKNHPQIVVHYYEQQMLKTLDDSYLKKLDAYFKRIKENSQRNYILNTIPAERVILA